MNYKHLNTVERGKIEVLNNSGCSAREIANILNRNHSTISRELKRIDLEYTFDKAQNDYITKRLKSGPKGKFSDELASEINSALEKTWSPEQIANTVTKGILSFKTIYNWIYLKRLVKGNLKVLRRKGRSRKPKETRGKFLIGRKISTRPKEINKREVFGHWELDTVVSSRGNSKGCFATFVERVTRFYTAIKIPDRTSKSMEWAIKRVNMSLPNGSFITATVDRGKEFACYSKIEEDLKIPIYFADPYSSWQRGSNENSNGLIREFYPKKTDLATVENEELIEKLFLINNRPRKCLNWKSPIQAFFEEVLQLT